MGSDKVLPVPLDTRARRQPGGGEACWALIVLCVCMCACVHVRMCACVMLLLSCGDGRLHQKSVPSLDAAWNTWARLGVSRTHKTQGREVCLDSASASLTPLGMRQERVAVWRDWQRKNFCFMAPVPSANWRPEPPLHYCVLSTQVPRYQPTREMGPAGLTRPSFGRVQELLHAKALSDNHRAATAQLRTVLG